MRIYPVRIVVYTVIGFSNVIVACRYHPNLSWPAHVIFEVKLAGQFRRLLSWSFEVILCMIACVRALFFLKIRQY